MAEEANREATRKALTSDVLYAFHKKETDALDNDMLELKSRVKQCLQHIMDYNEGLVASIDVANYAHEIYTLRQRMKAIHDKREALANTYKEFIELGFVKN